jgi:hypothetical protein
METVFCVCGLGYDKNEHITDYEMYLGDFDTYEEAYEFFVKLQCKNPKWFFRNASDVYQVLLQLEECEDDGDEINCIDVKNEWWIENPNFKEDLNMNNRINAIAEFAQKRDMEIANKKKQAEDREEFLKQTILGWSERIQQLIETANACLEYGIKFWHDSASDRNYDHNYFVTDGCSHILGFECNRFHPAQITRIGKEGGGCCYYDVFTDGKTIEATGDDRLWALEKFVGNFDEFETKFYAYVDKICKSK